MAGRSQTYVAYVPQLQSLLKKKSEELKTWGWHDVHVGDAYADMDHLGTTSVAEALHINGKAKGAGGNNIPYEVRHWDMGAKDPNPIAPVDRTYKVDGNEYRVRFSSLHCPEKAKFM